MAEAPEYLTVEEIAKRMRVAKMSVYRLIDSGRIPAVRFGRSFRIPREKFEALIEAGGTSNAGGAS